MHHQDGQDRAPKGPNRRAFLWTAGLALGLLGGYDWAGSSNQVFHGFIGDVRIVSRPLKVDQFMIAK
jgi:hypothetical protein